MQRDVGSLLAQTAGPPGLLLRTPTSGDRDFLRALYGEGRARERALLGWPDAQWDAFLNSQFLFQQMHYARHHAHADRWLIERPSSFSALPIGRLDLDRRAPVWMLLELAVRSTEQGRGVGSLCLCWLQAEARQAGAAAIGLHVLFGNDGAMRFYQRHGFVEAKANVATHRRMVWQVS